MSDALEALPVSAQYAGDSSPGAAEGQYVIGNQNRWSRVSLGYKHLTPDLWCELSFEIGWDSSEQARSVLDFASIGVAFLAEDGSSIDFGFVPGLARALIDPFSANVAGPEFLAPGAEVSRTARVRQVFFLPDPARQVVVTIRSWKNTHPFHVGRPVVRQFEGAPQERQESGSGTAQSVSEDKGLFRHPWITLSQDPVWFRYSLAPNRPLVVRGQVINERDGAEGALARIVFKDASGAILPPPYPGTMAAPALGAFQNIPMHTVARRFTLDLAPPPRATTVELGFQCWREEARIGLFPSLEVSLDEDLLFENIAQDASGDAQVFLKHVLSRLTDAPSIDGIVVRQTVLSLHSKFLAVRYGRRNRMRDAHLQLGLFPAWRMPQQPTWAEDPFTSPAWRLEYHSLSWLLDLIQEAEGDYLRQALDLAVSWTHAHIWSGRDDIALHPTCVAVRADVLAGLLAAGISATTTDPQLRETVLGELIRHCFALGDMLGQNALSSPVQQIHAACSLLVAAHALPNFPLSAHWQSIARARLEDGFGGFSDKMGHTEEASLSGRLEIVTLGMILRTMLPQIPAGEELEATLSRTLRNELLGVISLTDPTGRLPAFGDVPQGDHHAIWIRRLVFEYGQDLMTEPQIRLELSYPSGSRVIDPPGGEMIAARNYVGRHRWRYFCARVPGKPHSRGHFDFTSFTYAADGTSWIIDPGGAPLYQSEQEYDHLTSAGAHNLAVLRERPPTAGVAWLRSRTEWAGATILDIASNVHGPDYTHRRVFVLLQDLSAIAVFDRFASRKGPLSFAGHLHFGPDVATSLVNFNLVTGFKNRERIRILPHAIEGRHSGMELASGLDTRTGSMQGLVAASPCSVQPAPVLRYAFTGEGSVCGGVIMALDQAGLKTLSELLASPDLTALLRSRE